MVVVQKINMQHEKHVIARCFVKKNIVNLFLAVVVFVFVTTTYCFSEDYYILKDPSSADVKSEETIIYQKSTDHKEAVDYMWGLGARSDVVRAYQELLGNDSISLDEKAEILRRIYGELVAGPDFKNRTEYEKNKEINKFVSALLGTDSYNTLPWWTTSFKQQLVKILGRVILASLSISFLCVLYKLFKKSD